MIVGISSCLCDTGIKGENDVRERQAGIGTGFSGLGVQYTLSPFFL